MDTFTLVSFLVWVLMLLITTVGIAVQAPIRTRRFNILLEKRLSFVILVNRSFKAFLFLDLFIFRLNFIFVILQKVFGEEANGAAENNSCEDDQGQRGGHNYIRVWILVLIDPKDETKSYGSSDHASIPNEDKLLQTDIGPVSKQLDEFDKDYGSKKSAKYDDY